MAQRFGVSFLRGYSESISYRAGFVGAHRPGGHLSENVPKGIYYATPYYRISNDDGDFAVLDKRESNSISNQRSLIEDYVKDKPEIVLCEERVDDGFSGVNFERPAFKQMMEDVKAGKTNCIIVKDDCVIIELNGNIQLSIGTVDRYMKSQAF